MAEYAERDPFALEPHYSKHVAAMTAEGLHSKSAIAEELAHRDQVIENMQREIRNARTALLGEAGGWVALRCLDRALAAGDGKR